MLLELFLFFLLLYVLMCLVGVYQDEMLSLAQTLLGRPIGKTVEFEVDSPLSPGLSATWDMPITLSRVSVAVQYYMWL
jgi:hypothetical protein